MANVSKKTRLKLAFVQKVAKNEVESIAIGGDVYTLSAHQNVGLENLGKYIKTGKTVAFLGSSAVGKSIPFYDARKIAAVSDIF